MASLFHIVVLGLAMLAVQLEAGGALPSVHFINAAKSHEVVHVTIDHGRFRGLPVSVNPGKEYQIRVTVDEVYSVYATIGERKFTGFDAYEPAHDRSHADVYLKADDEGFSISYNKSGWMLVATWETE